MGKSLFYSLRDEPKAVVFAEILILLNGPAGITKLDRLEEVGQALIHQFEI